MALGFNTHSWTGDRAWAQDRSTVTEPDEWRLGPSKGCTSVKSSRVRVSLGDDRIPNPPTRNPPPPTPEGRKCKGDKSLPWEPKNRDAPLTHMKFEFSWWVRQSQETCIRSQAGDIPGQMVNTNTKLFSRDTVSFLHMEFLPRKKQDPEDNAPCKIIKHTRHSPARGSRRKQDDHRGMNKNRDERITTSTTVRSGRWKSNKAKVGISTGRTSIRRNKKNQMQLLDWTKH